MLQIKIKLNSRKYDDLYTTIDDEDYNMVKKHKWRAFKTQTKGRNNFYAMTDIKQPNGKWKSTYMHRILMDQPQRPFVVDHINGDGLDNRRENLRIVTQRQNILNRNDIIEMGESYRRKNGIRTISTQINVEDPLYDVLYKLANEEGRHITEIVRSALNEYFERNYYEFFEEIKKKK